MIVFVALNLYAVFLFPLGVEQVGWCQEVFVQYQKVIAYVQVIFVPWLGKPSHNFDLWCVQVERRTRKSHAPVSLLKVLCVPGVLNLGSFQRIIDAVQVSQPFVLRARCLTYFQAGMLGHTLAFITFVNTPQS